MTADYHDIPGTTVFDAEQSRLGYPINTFCMSLMTAENRAAFKSDEAGYLKAFGLSPAQTKVVLERDWNGMIAEGGNIYFTAKLAATDGLSFQQIAAKMAGVSQPEYAAMMLAGGRPIEGNRSKGEG
jgi:protocatechuate 4,5-dioxygenase alpha chain